MLKITIVALLCSCLCACVSMGASSVASVNATSGLLNTESTLDKANVVFESKVDPRAFSRLAIIKAPGYAPVWAKHPPDNASQLKEIHFFNEVLAYESLPQFVIEQHLQDSIPQPLTKEGVTKLDKLFGPSLFIGFSCKHSGDTIYQMDVFRSDTWERVFSSEVVVRTAFSEAAFGLLTLGAGMHGGCTSLDENGRFPLFNSLSAWLSKPR